MDSAPVFKPFGPAHLVVIGLTAGLPVLFWAIARGEARKTYRGCVRYALAALLSVNWICYEVERAMAGQFTPAGALPMQLCDWAMFAVIAALITRRLWVYEPAYFWGMAGTLQAILTPNLREGFPNLHFISFFVAHSGIVIAILFLTLVDGLRPRPVSIARAMLWSEVYLGLALLVNSATGANYGFLSHKPFGRSLLDYLSDERAIYLLQVNLLALAFYLALYLPFWLRDLIAPGKPRS